MNLIELLVVLLTLFISILFGRFFFTYIGWWGAAPAVILGIGTVGSILALLAKLSSPRRKN